MYNDLKSKKISELSSSLLEASKKSINSWKEIKRKQSKISFLENNFFKIYLPLILFAGSAISSILLYFYKDVVWWKWAAPVLLILLWVYFLISIIINIAIEIYKMKKHKMLSHTHLAIIQNMQDTIDSDLILLQELMVQDIDILEYALVHITSELESLTNRVSFLIGTLKKVGVLPAVLAFFILFQKVDLNNFHKSFHPIITAFLYATPCLYFLSGIFEEAKSHLERHREIYKLVIDIKNKEKSILQ
ncbi:hypothetical protein [Neisseria sp.]|uniref:hypothetical protein n=1 Tax=Neisseria sp. TaxID=192066 RepID=UPI0026DB65B4|nr:hypothetical protein [Neisseria sp.]MDO4907254.1 hypothetical protein [Neisseria sp.]